MQQIFADGIVNPTRPDNFCLPASRFELFQLSALSFFNRRSFNEGGQLCLFRAKHAKQGLRPQRFSCKYLNGSNNIYEAKILVGGCTDAGPSLEKEGSALRIRSLFHVRDYSKNIHGSYSTLICPAEQKGIPRLAGRAGLGVGRGDSKQPNPKFQAPSAQNLEHR